MKALTWHGKRDVRVENVPDPVLQQPTDAIVRTTSTAICGSDLHLYEVLGAYLTPGDILGHEPMGSWRKSERRSATSSPGDRVVVPVNISCGSCWMCSYGLYVQCETTQVTEHGKGAATFGYTSLHGAVPDGQADYLRVPQAHLGPIKVGLGPVGQFASRIGRHFGGDRVIGVDRVPERLALAAAHGVESLDLRETDDVAAALLEMTGGRGPGAVGPCRSAVSTAEKWTPCRSWRCSTAASSCGWAGAM